MSRWANTVARLSLSVWLGAALLFVTVAIKPIRAPELESPYRAFLAGLLFPGSYAFGVVLLMTGFFSTCLCSLKWKLTILFATGLAIALGVIDWFLIYSPLAEIARQQWVAQAAPPASFRNYHLASMAINAVTLICSAAAAMLACHSTEMANDDVRSTK